MSKPKTAIISDVHGNYQALKAVLADINRMSVTQIINLGDVTDYGPRPNQSIRLLNLYASISLLGNHDGYHNEGEINDSVSPGVHETFKWTQDVLNKSSKEYLRGLKESYKILETNSVYSNRSKIWLGHGSPEDPLNHYINDKNDLDYLFYVNGMEEVKMIFCGHTHKAFKKRVDNNKAVINVGSVGFSRDKRGIANYVTTDFTYDGTTIHELDYDYRKVQKDILSLKSPNGLENPKKYALHVGPAKAPA